MQEHMYGVVLWADASDTKAVIWCEDQGNLAYYTAAEEDIHEGPALDAGDLIQFELSECANFRRADNLRRVGAGYAPDLAQNLRGRVNDAVAPRPEPRRFTRTDNVVAFPGVVMS
ncbi:MAG: hypothetical protein ACU0CC_04725 [Sagittula sp.]|uniref:hypothetical protein n=2 Tax=Sagittula TaxID=58842 RepID=UPI0024C43B97|nr:hypothetical protein [Sagittula sp. MA-2]WHZ37441.1 hypothetical protein QNI11_10555 [Sagittula sp. MA-2]